MTYTDPFQLILAKLDILQEEVKQLREEAKKEPADETGTVNDASKWTKLPKSTIYKLTASRDIPYFKLGGSNRYSKKELAAWLQEHKPKTRKQIQKEVQEYTTIKRARS